MASQHEPAPQERAALERELATEQAHIDRVYACLDQASQAAKRTAAQGASLYTYDRADWAREEDGTALFERDAFTFQAARRIALLDSEHEGLVFGRLDHTNSEIDYIGRIGVRDDDYEPLVLDWRAPASEPFYRATPAEPMGIVRRRVLRCRGERVVGIEDDLLDGTTESDLPVIGEGALMAALARARGPQMRDIVATIQAEQDEAIRAPYQGVTIISGGPGTGKTVVALHRAAYLLYSYRRRFESGGVLVVGPSAIFMNYIERVLPSLGEDSVTLSAIGSVAHDVTRARSERVDDTRTATIKGSLTMVPVLKRLVADPLPETELELRVVVKGEALVLREPELLAIRRDALASQPLNKARSSVETLVLNALWNKLPEEIALERTVFDDLVTDQAAYVMFMHAFWPVLTPEAVLARLGDVRVAERVAADTLSCEDLDALVASYQPDESGKIRWSVADMALLDEIFAALGPVPAEADDPNPTVFLDAAAEVNEIVTTQDVLSRQIEVDPDDEGHQTFAHVLVDEAQDVTPMQWRMLRRRGPQASWTIVGDPAQSSWPDPTESERALVELIGTAPSRRFRMSTNYRSPAEVFDLAARVLAPHFSDADLPRAVRSTGVEPELRVVPSAKLEGFLEAELHRQLGLVAGTVAVIAPPSRLSLAQSVVERIDNARVFCLTPLGAKGLEYDATIVLSPDSIVAETSGGMRVLYVALTRPTQRLVTIDVDAEGAWRP